MKFTVVNQEFVPSAKASLLVSDLAIQRGYGVFDFFKTINNKPIFLDSHLDRLYSSAEEMRLPVSLTRSSLKDMLHALIEKNEIPNSGIRITVTGGYSPDGYSLAKPNLVITQHALEVNEHVMDQGIKIITYPYARQLYQAKTLDYVMAIWLKPVIEKRRANDVLYFSNGLVAECPRANFFMVTNDGRVITPRENVLKGVIRKNVLQLSGSHTQVLESAIKIDDLGKCREAFVTSTTKNILPVLEIDGERVGNGKPGEITLSLSKRLMERVHSG